MNLTTFLAWLPQSLDLALVLVIAGLLLRNRGQQQQYAAMQEATTSALALRDLANAKRDDARAQRDRLNERVSELDAENAWLLAYALDADAALALAPAPIDAARTSPPPSRKRAAPTGKKEEGA